MILEEKITFVDPIPSFPAEFKKLNFWAVYGKGKKLKENGDRDKEPCDPRTGRPANTVEGRSDFTSAVNVMADYHGLGFGPLPYNAGYSFLDFDDCVDPITRVVEPRIAQVIKEVGGYWEYSPSGTGVHGFGKWQAADQKGHKVGHAEIYPAGRYFTVTGDQVPGTSNVVEGHDLTRLYARIVSGEFVSEADKGKVSSTATPLDLKIRVPVGMHDTTIARYAGQLRHVGLSAEEMEPRIIRYVEEQFDGYGSDYLEMISKCVKSICRYPAGDPTPPFFVGSQNSTQQRAQENSKKQESAGIEVITEIKQNEIQEQFNEYPYWCWNGTLYEDFASLCGKDNVVPKEYYIEAVKTVVGAICGHRVLPYKAPNQESRFYSVLVGPAGCGKSSASRWARDMFIGTGLIYELAQTGSYTNIGCAQGSFASSSGLIKNGYSRHDRILQVYDEATTMIEKFGIQGSGDSFLDAMNQIFESGHMPQLTTKDSKDVINKIVHNSILGCTTKEKWASSFVKTNSESSGFFQRLNIVATEEEGRVANWVEPDLTILRDQFVKKIQPLEYQFVEVQKTAEAIEMLEKWYASKREEWKSLPTDVTGRIQVMVHRNTSHIAWLLSGEDVIPNPEKPDVPIEVICDGDIMERGIALAEYQIQARLMHQPAPGKNDWAVVENRIKQTVRERGMISRNDLSRAIRADNYGIQTFEKSINNLVAEGIIRIAKKEGEIRRGRKTQVIVWVGDEG